MASICMAAAIVASSASTISVERPTAVFVETHLEDQLSLFDYWHAAVSFRVIGFTAHLLSPYTGVNAVHPDNLTDFVAVLLITPRDSDSFDYDVDMFADYVAAGSGLIVAGQSGSHQFEPWARAAVNKLTSKFGIEFQNDLVCDPDSPFLADPRYAYWPMISRFAQHNVTEGLARISYQSGCSLKLSGNATAIAWTSENAWSDIDGDQKLDPEEEVGEKVVAAVSTYGKGRVACIGDNNLWTSRFLDGFDNNGLLLNMLKWVSRAVEQPEVKVLELELEPKASLQGDGNYSVRLPIRIWNQGTVAAKNFTLRLQSGKAETPGGNVTYETIGAGQVIDDEIEIRFCENSSRNAVFQYEYFTPKERQYNTLRTLTLSKGYDLYSIPTIFRNQTDIAVGMAGGWGNYTVDEMKNWSNVTRNVFAGMGVLVNQTNHTNVASKVGTTFSVQYNYAQRDLIGIGDPDSNYLCGYVSQKGLLRVVDNSTAPRVLAPGFFANASLEEMLASIPRLSGSLSDWGYLSLMCEESTIDQGHSRLAVSGLGRQGLETAVLVLEKIIRGEMGQYREQLSGRVALFRGIYDEQGQLVEVEFY